MISLRARQVRNRWLNASMKEVCPGFDSLAREAGVVSTASFIFCLSLVPAGLAAPGQKRWEYQIEARPVHSSPAVGANGLLFVGGNDKLLHALDTSTGKKRWTCRPGEQAIDASPAVGPDGTVYVVSSEGAVSAVDGTSGSRKWQARIGGRAVSSPALGRDGTVYVGSDNHRIYAFDSAKGAQKWVFETKGLVRSSPSVGLDGTVYVGSYDYKVYALEASSGLKLWDFTTEGAVVASPAIALDGRVFIGSEDQKVYALDGFTGAKLWEFATGGQIWSSAAVGQDGAVYVGSDDGKLYALNDNTGAKRWEYDTGDIIWSSPALAADGTLYVGCDNGCLYALDGVTGKELWRLQTGARVWSSPAIGPDGTVYVGTTVGKVLAVEGTAELAKSSWPKFRGSAPGSGVIAPPTPATAPVILWQPEVVPLRQGTNGTVAVRATGWPASFCWYRDGVALPGATNGYYSVAAAQRSNDGIYTLVISNSAGQTTSQPIAVAVSNVDAERLVVLEWKADGPTVVKLQWADDLGPTARWHGFLSSSTGSGPLVVPGQYLTRPARFFRLQGWAASRINRVSTRSGFRLSGPSGSRYAVEYVSRETGWVNWQVLTNLHLTTSPQLFVDPESSWAAPRVYRVNRLP